MASSLSMASQQTRRSISSYLVTLSCRRRLLLPGMLLMSATLLLPSWFSSGLRYKRSPAFLSLARPTDAFVRRYLSKTNKHQNNKKEEQEESRRAVLSEDSGATSVAATTRATGGGGGGASPPSLPPNAPSSLDTRRTGPMPRRSVSCASSSTGFLSSVVHSLFNSLPPFPDAPASSHPIVDLSPCLSSYRVLVGSLHEDFLLVRRQLSAFLVGHLTTRGTQQGGLVAASGILGLVFRAKPFQWTILPLVLRSQTSHTNNTSSSSSRSSHASLLFQLAPPLSGFIRLRVIRVHRHVWLEVAATHPPSSSSSRSLPLAVIWLGAHLAETVRLQQQMLVGRRAAAAVAAEGP
eukprot:GHVS01084949.1.p1 GENE.GHVS01084949.1~~GHVS01084949.1.p1  ORF type:complete len:350 (+),score=85.94 GHVS01084949.1:262-1311(+)